jgi:hypothetical protein
MTPEATGRERETERRTQLKCVHIYIFPRIWMIRLRQGRAGSFIDLSEITCRPHSPRHLAREVVLVVARDDVADRERDVLVLVDADPVLRRGYMVLTGYSGSERRHKTTQRSKPQRRSKQNSTAARHKATSERIKRTALSRLEGLDGSECEAAAAAALVADLFNRASIASTQ